jgi:hypothetical protein
MGVQVTTVRRLRADHVLPQTPHVCAMRPMVRTDVRPWSSLRTDRVSANTGVLYFSIAVARTNDARRGLLALRPWNSRIVGVEMKA